MMCSSLQQGPGVVLLHRCFSPGQTLPPRQQSSYRPKHYVQHGCRVWHCSTTITHFLATIAVQTTDHLPQNKNNAATASPLSLPRQAYTTAVSMVHICTQGTAAVTRPLLIRYGTTQTRIANFYFTNLLRVVNRRSSYKAMSLSFKQGTMLATHHANTTTISLYNVNLVYTTHVYTLPRYTAVLPCKASPSQAKTSELMKNSHGRYTTRLY